MGTGSTGGRILYYEDGEVIFAENSISNEVYIIESGKVEISQRIRGKKTAIAILSAGDFLGEVAVFTDAPLSTTATAAGRTTLMSFSIEEVLQHMQTNLQFAIRILTALMTWVYDTTSTLGNLISNFYKFSDSFIEGVIPEKSHLKLGEILLEKGLVTDSQLERALQKQRELHMLENSHKLLGEIMVESGVITEEQMRGALAEQRLRLRHGVE